MTHAGEDRRKPDGAISGSANHGAHGPDAPIDPAVSTSDQAPTPASETLDPPSIVPPGGEQAYEAQMHDKAAEESMAKATRYLVHMRVDRPSYTDESPEDRIRKAAPALLEVLGRLSDGECQLAYTSEDGETFGVFMKTESDADRIRDIVQDLPTFRNNDDLLVLELGERFAAAGDNVACAWLQHH